MDDLISRQAVLDMIEGFIADATSHGISARLDPYYVMDGIKALPSVKPQEPCDVPDTNIGKMSENSTGSRDVIWYSKRNYSEIVVEPQEESEGI